MYVKWLLSAVPGQYHKVPTPSPSLLGWLFLLAVSDVVLLLAFGCVTPFAATVAVSLAILPYYACILSVLVTWATNQAIGFTLFDFPTTFNSIAWGIAILMAGILSCLVAIAVTRKFTLTRFWQLAISFHVTLVSYKLFYLATSVFLSSEYDAFEFQALKQAYIGELISLGFLLSVGIIGVYLERKQH